MYPRAVWCFQYFPPPANHCHVPFSKAFPPDLKLSLRLTFTQQNFPGSSSLVKEVRRQLQYDLWFLRWFTHQNYISHSTSSEPEISLLELIQLRGCVLYKEPGFCSQNWSMLSTTSLFRNCEAWESYLCFLKLKLSHL